MIRNLMFGISLLALSGASAVAAPAVKHNAKASIVAEAAPATDSTAPADKPVKKEKKAKKAKTEGKTEGTKTEGAKEMAPAPATK